MSALLSSAAMFPVAGYGENLDVCQQINAQRKCQTHSHTHTHSHTFKHTHTHTLTHTFTCTLTHTLTFSHTHIHTLSHTHTLTHTMESIQPLKKGTPPFETTWVKLEDIMPSEASQTQKGKRSRSSLACGI